MRDPHPAARGGVYRDAFAATGGLFASPHRSHPLDPSPAVPVSMPAALPIVMTFSACDPTGGAGMQADLMTVASLGCHAATIVTGYTVQDTAGVEEFVAIDADHVDDQARLILEDMPIAAFKIGVLGDVETVAAIAEIVSDYPDVPVILDPVLASGRGDVFADEDTLLAMRELLIPQITLITPNSYEVRRLAAIEDGGDHDADNDDPARATLSLEAAAAKLIGWGVGAVLVTGTHETSVEVINRLYGHKDKGEVDDDVSDDSEDADDIVVLLRSDAWKRLPGSYHGSGCTLASAIAALLAHGSSLDDAVREAQEYTWQTLQAGFRPGMGQFIPDRLFWARHAAEAPRLRGVMR